MLRVIVCSAAMISLVGCASPPQPAPKPYSEMTQKERCSMSMNLLGNGYLEPFQKAAVLERMRNDGCLGQSQEQNIRIR